MNTNKTGLFIKTLRQEKGLSQQELANIIYVDRTLVSKWENCKIDVDLKYIPKLCEIFNVNIDEIIYGERINSLNNKDANEYVDKYFKKQSGKLSVLKKITMVSLFVTITIVFLFLIYYFYQTFNTTRVYKIYGSSEHYSIDNGIIVITRENSYLNIGNIDYSKNHITLYTFDNNGDKKIIYEGNSNNIITDYYGYNASINLKNIDIIKDNLYLEIEGETIKLELSKEYSNSSIIMKNQEDITEFAYISTTNEIDIKNIKKNWNAIV